MIWPFMVEMPVYMLTKVRDPNINIQCILDTRVQIVSYKFMSTSFSTHV